MRRRWDHDGGGSLAYKELKRLLSGQAPPKQKKTELKLSGQGPMSEQLADALRSQATYLTCHGMSWHAMASHDNMSWHAMPCQCHGIT